MAGHSKWANIKFRKERQDAKRGKVFTKLIKELSPEPVVLLARDLGVKNHIPPVPSIALGVAERQRRDARSKPADKRDD